MVKDGYILSSLCHIIEHYKRWNACEIMDGYSVKVDGCGDAKVGEYINEKK